MNCLYIVSFYSTRNASTGFFLAAILEGINPPMNVNTVEIAIRPSKCNTLTWATPVNDSSKLVTIILIGNVSK